MDQEDFQGDGLNFNPMKINTQNKQQNKKLKDKKASQIFSLGNNT